MTPAPTTLILGWGNPGRGDDGLGPAFVDAFAKLALPGVVVDADYQLTVEDSEEVARHRRVVFVDADRQGTAPFRMRRLRPGTRAPGFSTHSVAPASVLALSRDLFAWEPEAWLLGIRGYAFDEFGEGLSNGARDNLALAVEFLRAGVESGSFRSRDPHDEVDRCPIPSA